MKHLKSPLDRKRHPCSFPPHLSAVPYDESMLGILRNRSSLYVIGRTVCILGGTDIRDARRRVAVEHLASPCHGHDSKVHPCPRISQNIYTGRYYITYSLYPYIVPTSRPYPCIFIPISGRTGHKLGSACLSSIAQCQNVRGCCLTCKDIIN